MARLRRRRALPAHPPAGGEDPRHGQAAQALRPRHPPGAHAHQEAAPHGVATDCEPVEDDAAHGAGAQGQVQILQLLARRRAAGAHRQPHGAGE